MSVVSLKIVENIENKKEKLIACSNVSYFYKNSRRTLLTDVNFSLLKGEHISIVGRSGVGKTTLLDLISKRKIPTNGKVKVSGKICTIFQDLRLVPQLSALTNTLLGTLNKGNAVKGILGFNTQDVKKAKFILSELGLTSVLNQAVSKLSGGEKQRVAIARALIQNPDVILCDEPVASLDEVSSIEILKTLKKVIYKNNVGVISILHNLNLAKKYSDSVYLLDDGKLSEVSEEKDIPSLFTKTIDTIAIPKKTSKSFLTLSLISIISTLSFLTLYKDIELPKLIFSPFISLLSSLIPNSFQELKELPWKELVSSLLETIQMSAISTFIASFFALPLAFLASSNVSSKFISAPIRFVLNIFRTIPAIIWALLLVSVLGLGVTTGITALTIHSTAYLAKFFYEAFESVPSSRFKALTEIGASKLQAFYFALIPAALPVILSSYFFMLEYNVRSASILGIVDAGGIGFYLKQYLDLRFFSAVGVCLALLFLVVYCLDFLSKKVRRFILEDF